jgi:NADH dehydrogenase [ubiquinone] 1 alpha subcomplex assembly factor 1
MANEDVRILLDFDDPAEVDGFSAIDDAVMGGVSSSRLVQAAPGIAAFEGRVSLENNGGFASVRSRPRDWGMAGATALVLRLRGDGKRYRINLRTPNTPSAFRFEAPLDLPAGEWREVEVPVSALRAKAFGRSVPLVGPPDPARVRQVGFMISDAQAGPFRLEIDWIGWK